MLLMQLYSKHSPFQYTTVARTEGFFWLSQENRNILPFLTSSFSGFAHLIPLLSRRLREKGQAQEQDVTHMQTHSHMGAVSSTKTGYLGKFSYFCNVQKVENLFFYIVGGILLQQKLFIYLHYCCSLL